MGVLNFPKYSIIGGSEKSKPLIKWLSENLGNPTFYHHNSIGGKKWAIFYSGNFSFDVHVDDEILLTTLALRFS